MVATTILIWLKKKEKTKSYTLTTLAATLFEKKVLSITIDMDNKICKRYYNDN